MDNLRNKKIQIVRNWIKEWNLRLYPDGTELDGWLINKQAAKLVDKLENKLIND